MTNPYNEQMPDDPGAPEATDEQYVSPDQAETLADEAAESEALATDEDPLLAADADLEGAAEIADAEVNPDADGDGAVSDIELQLAERTESLQRVSADYANYRRRTERDRQAVIETAKAKVIADFLPVLDDLELADEHGDLEGPLKAFADKLHSTLEKHELAAFGEEGDAFDPEVHEAVQDLSSGDEQVLGTVLRKGYRVGDRLVRNALVIIADPSDETGSSEDSE